MNMPALQKQALTTGGVPGIQQFVTTALFKCQFQTRSVDAGLEPGQDTRLRVRLNNVPSLCLGFAAKFGSYFCRRVDLDGKILGSVKNLD